MKKVIILLVLICAFTTTAFAQPKTVTDYYLALPGDIYGIDNYGEPIKGKKELEKFRRSLISIEDVENDYLKLQGIWEGWAEIVLFRKTDGNVIVALAEAGCGPACSGYVRFYSYQAGKWTDITDDTLPNVEEAELEKLFSRNKLPLDEGIYSYYLLPRGGKTIKMACNECSDEEHFTLLEFEWNGAKFIRKRSHSNR
jgi:hypothetical protein